MSIFYSNFGFMDRNLFSFGPERNEQLHCSIYKAVCFMDMLKEIVEEMSYSAVMKWAVDTDLIDGKEIKRIFEIETQVVGYDTYFKDVQFRVICMVFDEEMDYRIYKDRRDSQRNEVEALAQDYIYTAYGKRWKPKGGRAA